MSQEVSEPTVATSEVEVSDEPEKLEAKPEEETIAIVDNENDSNTSPTISKELELEEVTDDPLTSKLEEAEEVEEEASPGEDLDIEMTDKSPAEDTPNGDMHDDNERETDSTEEGEKKEETYNKLGYSPEGTLMAGFEDVVDEYLSFTSDSDFTIFNRQIASDIPLQRLVAVKRLGSSCSRFGCEASFSLINRIRNVATDKEMVIRQTCAEQLGPYAKYLIEITNDSPRAHNLIINDLLPLIKEMLRDAMEVRQASGSSLIMMAELLTKEEVYEHVLKIVLHMAHDDTDDQKISALPLLGDLAPIVGRSVCKNYLSSDLHALSQDNSFRVRKATVQYFGPICEQLGSEDAEKTLLPIFKQLCQDSIWSVRKGCVESFVNVANSIHQETRETLIPIMEKFLTDTSRWVRNTAYEQLGPFISTLTTEQITETFLKYYANVPHLSSAEADADCTNHCAFNFPAVVLTLGKERWGELSDTYNILVRKTFKSRKTLACSIHEICEILGTEMTEQYLMNAIEFFLKDIDDIREGIIKHLWKILKVLGTAKRAEHIATLWELGSESDVNWRFRLLLADQLDEITPLYNPQQVEDQIVPLAFQLCDDRMADVRYSAVKAIAELVNYFDQDEMKSQLDVVMTKCNLIHSARTYSKRLLYVKMCRACKARVRPELFQKLFLANLLQYADDRISNVRLALARFVHSHIASEEGYSEMEEVKACVEKLRQDSEDVEVRRLFSTEAEIEEFLEILKKRDPPSSTVSAVPKPPQATQDMEESDSTLYSSSDDDMDDSDEDITQTNPLDEKEDTALRNFDVQTDQIQTQISEDDEAEAAKNRDAYTQSKEKQEVFETGLLHTPTPYRLPHLDSDSDSDDDKESKKQENATEENNTEENNTEKNTEENTEENTEKNTEKNSEKNTEENTEEVTDSNPKPEKEEPSINNETSDTAEDMAAESKHTDAQEDSDANLKG